MTTASRGRGQAGFTLVEVMLALAIFAGGLVVLLRSAASNIYATERAEMLTAATSLARAKMYDVEEQLAQEGFQETDKEEDGSFSEEGWSQIHWKVETIKIELPDLAALQGLASGQGQGGAAAGAEGAGGMAGGLLGAGGGAQGTTPADAAGAGMMGTYYQMISDVLTEAIRKVRLTVTYPVIGDEETLVVTCYFTDPSAVNRKIPFAGGAAGGDEEGTGTGAGGTGTGGTGTGGTGTGGKGTGGLGTGGLGTGGLGGRTGHGGGGP